MGYLASGNTREVAATLAGVHKSSFFDWMSRGRVPNASKLYRDLVDAVDRAEAAAVAYAVRTVQRASLTNVQAAQWWLERRYPDQWGRKDRIAIETLKRTEAEQMSRDLGIDLEEVLIAIDGILSGSG